jgi:hypothetical protein
MWSVPRCYKQDSREVRGSKTVKYGHESRGTRTRKWLPWRVPGAIENDRPVLSSEPPTSTNPQMSHSNKNLVVSPRWVLYSKIDWTTDRRSYVRLRLRLRLRLSETQFCTGGCEEKSSVMSRLPAGNGVSAWSWRISTVRNRYQGTASEDTAG